MILDDHDELNHDGCFAFVGRCQGGDDKDNVDSRNNLSSCE